jgi:hypothetical protein
MRAVDFFEIVEETFQFGVVNMNLIGKGFSEDCHHLFHLLRLDEVGPLDDLQIGCQKGSLLGKREKFNQISLVALLFISTDDVDQALCSPEPLHEFETVYPHPFIIPYILRPDPAGLDELSRSQQFQM